MRKEIMQNMGVIKPLTSDWSSPIILVNKKDGSLRLCMDFRKPNATYQSDVYPFRWIDKLVKRIGKAITTLYFCKGYCEVPLEKSRESTASRTPMGLFQSTTMPFGLQEVPVTFQLLMYCETVRSPGMNTFNMSLEQGQWSRPDTECF